VAVIVLVSGKGSPGVTTCALALGLTWPVPTPTPGEPDGDRATSGAIPRTPSCGVLVVDADPAGCGVAVGYLRGEVSRGGGLLSVIGSPGLDLENALWANTVALDRTGRRLLLPGLCDTWQVAAMSAGWLGWAGLADALASASEDGSDVLIDLGRLGPGSPEALLHCADLLVVVARSTLASVCGARQALHQLQGTGTTQSASGASAPVALLVGRDAPYSRSEISASLGVPVLARISWDPDSARVLSEGEPAGWRFGRSTLLRSARVAASSIPAVIAASTAMPVTVASPSPSSAIATVADADRGMT
jgi:hypothetical protein